MERVECVFAGGKKKKSPPKKSKASPKYQSYCYHCNTMTADLKPISSGNIRSSQCTACNSKRSVYTH